MRLGAITNAADGMRSDSEAMRVKVDDAATALKVMAVIVSVCAIAALVLLAVKSLNDKGMN
jgi:hypothetical protein